MQYFSGSTRWQSWRLEGWTLLVGAIALLLSLPILTVLSSILTPSGNIWSHLASTVLGSYLFNSLALMLGVGCGVIGVGVSTAWLVTMCRFRGSRALEWLLLLPLAAPAYILAYVYTELLEYYGPIQTGLRALFGWSSAAEYWFPPVRSLPGAILMLTLVLYPYVYLLARVAFLEQSVCTLEASRALGCNPWQSFRRVALPLARPAIAAGTALALMETLSDFGTVQFFSVNTFTTGIYRTWFGMGERIAASQLAACLMGFILVLILVERWFRQRAKYYQSGSLDQRIPRYALGGMREAIAQSVCVLPILIGFVIPAITLLQLTLASWNETFNPRFWSFVQNSLLMAGLTAGICGAIALIMAYGLRLHPTRSMILAVRLAVMGYAIPGSVIAVGILIPMGQVDQLVDAVMKSTFGISTGLLLSGTIAALIFAYLVRFLAVAFSTVEASLERIKPNLDEAAHSLGHNTQQTLTRVHVPLMRSGLLTAALLVFVDVMKELPATLIVRPFDFDTLAVRVYQLASDERLAEAAAPALTIVLVGMIPVLTLSWQIRRRQSSSSGEN
ncbi:MAG: iron ABC transporter permease [Timaviella obliquedivisa GSE-PSE-MK23-08B]|jgi:iron(III) transport system permease protein|nr:iron ABC transporter permease [Timaviella obliquedivisa GSE-PSE-MK23-08B]